ncbi:MAG: hypothetical protein ACK5N4_08040 [Parabacteroides gordonii]|uniref:hypothetical protein n=1 Tax=Parabacteroides gordonii TaxID=574930 RepID=UPI003A86ABD6
MNKTVLTIVQTDSGGNDAQFTVIGERNGFILFEEDFVYDGKVPPLKLHLEKEKFMKELAKKAENSKMDDIDISTRCVLKMLLDLSDSKVDYLSNYGEKRSLSKEIVIRELEKISREMKLSFDDDKVLTEWCRRNKPGMPNEIAKEIFPIYTSKLKPGPYGVRIDNGIVTHIKEKKEGCYEPISNSVSSS